MSYWFALCCYLFTLPLLAQVTPTGMTVASRLKTPVGFQRVYAPQKSFGAYLQQHALMPDGTVVTTYNGIVSPNNQYAAAVLAVEVGKKDLLQCADAVMRLRADYLYQSNQQNAIQFHFVNGFLCDYPSYQAGKRFDLKSNQWKLSQPPNSSYANYLAYLDLVYSYASTLSLEKELQKVQDGRVQVGDVLIRGGSPGHCFIVVDMVQHPTTKAIWVALAQGFMPAQHIHIVKTATGNYWFSLSQDYTESLPYGELIQPKYLRRFVGNRQ